MILKLHLSIEDIITGAIGNGRQADGLARPMADARTRGASRGVNILARLSSASRQRLSTARAASEPRRRSKRNSIPTAAAAPQKYRAILRRRKSCQDTPTSRWWSQSCETSLRRLNSLLTGKITGKFQEFELRAEFSRRIDPLNQLLIRKFPRELNREFNPQSRENFPRRLNIREKGCWRNVIAESSCAVRLGHAP
jgi:hypothetical protein